MGEAQGVPHLIEFLSAEYERDKTEVGQDGSFRDWAVRYLAEHRTVENFPADNNIGIKLSNNKLMLVHPPTDAGSGDMQDSGAVPVTEGRTQKGQEGVVPVTDAKRVI